MCGRVGLEEKSALSGTCYKAVEQGFGKIAGEAISRGAGFVWGLSMVLEDWIVFASGLIE